MRKDKTECRQCRLLQLGAANVAHAEGCRPVTEEDQNIVLSLAA